MYKYLLAFLCLSFLGCATNNIESVDLRKIEAEKNNERLDVFHINSLVYEKDTTKLNELITSGKINVNTDRTVFQNTITHIMSDCNLKGLQLVLNNGAPLDEINIFEDTPLSVAVDNNKTACAQELISRGARLSGKFRFDSPLIYIAASKNNIEMLKLLIKHNACPLENGFIDTPVLKIHGLTPEVSEILTEYINSYTQKYGNKCLKQKSLPNSKKDL